MDIKTVLKERYEILGISIVSIYSISALLDTFTNNKVSHAAYQAAGLEITMKPVLNVKRTQVEIHHTGETIYSQSFSGFDHVAITAYLKAQVLRAHEELRAKHGFHPRKKEGPTDCLVF